jgi:hypothetical protein
MFLEKIDEQLLKEIQDALDEEHDEIVANWDGEIIDLENEDFDDKLRSEIFSDYLNIPLHMLVEMINRHFPFLKENQITIDPFSEVIFSDNGDNKEVTLRVYADIYDDDREILNETESTQLDKLLEELTQLYEDLDIETTLYITQASIEDVPEDYYEDEEEEEHDFVQIEF